MSRASSRTSGRTSRARRGIPRRTANACVVTQEARAERTVRLLTLRLEELAAALERTRTPSADVARLLELASVATMHAVSLELLTMPRAERVWREA